MTLLSTCELSCHAFTSAPLKYLIHLVRIRSLHLQLRRTKLPVLVHHDKLWLLALSHLIGEVILVVLLERRVLNHPCDRLLRVDEVLSLRYLHAGLLLLLLLRHEIVLHLHLLLVLILRQLHHLQLHPPMLVLLTVLVVALQR